MRKITFLLALFLVTISFALKAQDQLFISSDVARFWEAYDKINSTSDSAEKLAYINDLYINRGTPGLKAIMAARRYTAAEYVSAIAQYPRFWNSIRQSTLKADSIGNLISKEMRKLRKTYPDLRPTPVYFTIGLMRTGGTVRDGMVLIGSELALADKNAVTEEFPAGMSNLRNGFDLNMSKMIFLIFHEYVHTQQKPPVAEQLLPYCVMEGAAEFVAVKASGSASTAPAIAYGYANTDKVRTAFQRMMFSPNFVYWLWSNAENEFGTRDLGYYIGYAICEAYYNKQKNKVRAIKNIIELNYNSDSALALFIDQSGYFSSSYAELQKQFEAGRPIVTGIREFNNKNNTVDAGLQQITLQFSAPMDTRFRSFDFGPLGESNVLRFKKLIGWSPDATAFSFEIELQPAQRYQLLVNYGFRTTEGLQLIPYLIDFETAK